MIASDKVDKLPIRTAEKVDKLRQLLKEGRIDGWLIPRSDEHQGEYVAAYADRLAWLTGFTGSAGMAIVLKDKAAILVDGRYTLQARNQVDTSLFEVVFTGEKSPGQWLAENAAGYHIGFDPWLHTEAEIQRYQIASKGLKTEFTAIEGNLIDDIWDDQPAMPKDPAVIFPNSFAGESSQEKRQRLSKGLKEEGVDAAILTNLDSISWLLNIRGSDVPCMPLVLSFATLHADGSVDLFVDRDKISKEVETYLSSDVRLHSYEKFAFYLDEFAKKRVTFDPKTAPIQVWYGLKTAEAELVRANDVCLLPKACKNSTELNGMRACHIRDGAALTKFLCWVSKNVHQGNVSELDAVDKLYSFRQQVEHFKGQSFDTISGAGSNGAIIHYRVTPGTNRPIKPEDIYLSDSGGQYLDGTTDVTRTVAFQTPTEEQRDRFTRVLKGHIAMATAIFPAGTSGAQLDTLARQFLWQQGLDYQHGTGHGVGHYLCVHEGPQRIAKGLAVDIPLRSGMVVSNEPGYYKEGEYGIRIENLVIVTEVNIKGAESKMLGFETITMAPICHALIKVGLLTETEKEWLNAYHKQVREALSPLLDAETKEWLNVETTTV